MDRNGLAHLAIEACMTAPPITAQPYDTLAQVLELMTSNHFRRLPVVEHDHLVGIITWSDVLSLRQPDPVHRLDYAEIARQLSELTVGTVMSREPVTVYASQPLGHAAALMLEHKIGGLPVLNNSKALVGMLTESNIFQVLARRWREDNERFSGAKPG